MSIAAVCAVLAPWPRGELRGAILVARQRDHARRALRAAAEHAGAELHALDKDERDAPLPSNGWHWSLSHCRTFVAACVHRAPVGIDVEDRGNVRAGVVERVLSPQELALFGPSSRAVFLRGWTAKEAVLKRLGVGLAGLDRVRVVGVPSEVELTIELDGRRLRVWQRVRPEVVVAVNAEGEAPVDCVVYSEPLQGAAGHGPWP